MLPLEVLSAFLRTMLILRNSVDAQTLIVVREQDLAASVTMNSKKNNVQIKTSIRLYFNFMPAFNPLSFTNHLKFKLINKII